MVRRAGRFTISHTKVTGNTAGGSCGFTLIELLVVISIIAVLMSILMPVIGKAKSSAKAVVCMHQLHQWGLIWKLYTEDNRGFFIDSPYWFEELRPYYKNPKIRLCPMATKTAEEGGRGAFQAWGGTYSEFPDLDYWGSYGLNQWVGLDTGGGRSEEKLWKTPNIKEAAYVPMFMDCCKYENVCPYVTDQPPQYDGDFLQSGANDDEMKRVCINRHNMAINIVFVDFSVRRVKLKELWELRWHRDWAKDLATYGLPEWPAWMDY